MYIAKYHDFKQTILLNNWDETLTPSEYILPDPPNLEDVFNYHLPESKQKWRIPHAHLYHSNDRWNERLFLKKTTARERDEFEEQEVDRRLNGFWLFINGELTWFTGLNYFYLAHWHIDIGYPEYRKRDRLWYYFWDLCDKDPFSFGMAYVKHRREGATYRAGCANYEKISRMAAAHGGIQSKKEDDAKEVFRKAIVYPWRKLPKFFRPIFDGSTNPQDKLNFITPSVRTTSKNPDLDFEDESLESFIDYGPQNEDHYDGPKLQFAHQDEVGKTKLANVKKRWNIIKQCLKQGNLIIGKGLLTSTVAEMTKEGGENYYLIFKNSDVGKRDENGWTISGLYGYFCPSWYGLEGFNDEFGNPMEAEGKKFLNNTIESLRKAGDDDELNDFLRMFPWTLKHAFRKSSSDCAFSITKINERMDELEEQEVEERWVRGRLEWIPTQQPDGTWLERLTRVEFVQDDNGRFEMLIGHYPRGFDSNQVEKLWDNTFAPRNKDRNCIGVDPYDHKRVKDQKRKSMGSIHGMRKYDPLVDNEKKPKSEWLTYKFILRYCARPAPNDFYEDVCMACWYFGCEAFIENSKPGCIHYMEEHGFTNFIAKRPASSMGVSDTSRDSNELGAGGSGLMKNAIFNAIDIYISDYSELMDDEKTLEDWRDANFQDLTPFDKTVSSGYCLLLAKPYIRPQSAWREEDMVFVNVFNNNGMESVRVESSY